MELLSKRNISILVLVVYTYLNIRIFYPFLFGADHLSYLYGMAIQNNGSSLLALFIGLFLNAAIVIYFLKRD